MALDTRFVFTRLWDRWTIQTNRFWQENLRKYLSWKPYLSPRNVLEERASLILSNFIFLKNSKKVPILLLASIGKSKKWVLRGKTIVKDFVQKVLPQQGISALLRYETKPGEQAQVYIEHRHFNSYPVSSECFWVLWESYTGDSSMITWNRLLSKEPLNHQILNGTHSLRISSNALVLFPGCAGLTGLTQKSELKSRFTIKGFFPWKKVYISLRGCLKIQTISTFG